jgi:general secretion pathway protein F
MKTYEYRGFERSGAARRGLIEASDVKEARELLVQSGILPETVAPAGKRRYFFGAPLPPPFPLATRSFFYHELGVLLDSGMPLIPALTVQIQAPEMGAARPLLGAVRDRVREGESLAQALAAVCSQIQPYEQAIVAVGERSGALAEILQRLALFIEEQQRLRERVQSALIYPAIVLSFALVMAVVMLGFVIPSAARLLLEETHLTLPLLTRIMMRLGGVLAWALPAALIACALLAWTARRRWRRDAAFRSGLDRIFFRLPVVGRSYLLLANLRFARAFAILLRGGVPVVESLDLAGVASGSPWVAEGVRREAEAVRHGSSLVDAIRRVPPLADALGGWVQAGEAGSAVIKLLETAADSLQYRWNRYITRALSLLEPALIALIGAFVLVVVLAVLLPLTQLNQILGTR